MNVTDPDKQPSVAPLDEPDFRLIVSGRADGTLVVAQGELDLATAPELEAVLMAQTGPAVVDLRGLTFIDASGLRVLLKAEAHSRQNGHHVKFIAGWAVRRLTSVAGVRDELTYIEPPD